MEYDKILVSRLFLSFICTFALHLFPLSFYSILTNFDLVHPLDWLVNSTFVVANLGTWVSLIPVHFLVFLICYVLADELKKPPSFTSSRFRLVVSLFSQRNILKWLLFLVLGFMLPWAYLRLNGDALTKICENSSTKLCLDETSAFLVMSGMWTGVYYFIRFNAMSEKCPQFPVIRQLRFLQIRSKFPACFRNCLKTSILPVFYYFLFYFWYGKQVTGLFEFVLSAPCESLVLTRISGLLDISLWIRAWLMSSVYFITIETLRLMIQIHFTEHYSFPLIKQPNSNSVLLSRALGEQNMPIIQHLACYDLYNLSISQKSIRWQVFTLSQPGGHPHTWNAILHESIKLIDKFICEIQEIYKAPEPKKLKSPIPKHFHMRDMTLRHEEIISGPVPLSPTTRIRNLVDHPQKSPITQQPSAMDEVWAKLESYNTVLQQNSVISYVFGSKPDAKVRFLVSNSQPIIWVIQSISELSANALMEDQFGIVLKDLPLIINTLLRLKFSLDKLATFQKKFQKRDHDLCMKASLKSALRRSLYRIAITYSDYLTDLPLPPENVQCMQSFVNFKEC